MRTPDFLGAFYFYKTETLTDCNGQDIDIECQEVGNLVLPTGRIVACDGLIPSSDPFTEEVPPGSYPVVLSLVIGENWREVACAMLRFSSAMPETWKLAIDVSYDPEKSYGMGYGVDTGTGCFADLEAMQTLKASPEKYDHLQKEVYKHQKEWVNFPLNADNECNIFVFSSGYGDGCYPCYFGYDIDGNRVCLATDFGIVAPLPGRETETPSKFQLKLEF